jgi:hypothetical protein
LELLTAFLYTPKWKERRRRRRRKEGGRGKREKEEEEREDRRRETLQKWKPMLQAPPLTVEDISFSA